MHRRHVSHIILLTALVWQDYDDTMKGARRTEAQAAVSAAAFGRLAREHDPLPCRPRMHLVHHHVLQLLVVHRTHEHEGLERLACAPDVGQLEMPV